MTATHLPETVAIILNVNGGGKAVDTVRISQDTRKARSLTLPIICGKKRKDFLQKT